MKIKLPVIVQALCFVNIAVSFAQPIGGTSGIGKWSSKIQFDMVPVSVSNLPNGKLLMWSADHATEFHDDAGAEAHTMTAMYDPVTKQSTTTTLGHAHHNMFCPGISNLADGRILVTGGISNTSTSIYDPKTDRWSMAEDMNFGRGYQGAVTLSNGASFLMGGSWSGGIANTKPAELWTAESGWCTLPNIPVDQILLDGVVGPENHYRQDNHAWLWPAPNGKVFHAGPSSKMHWIDPVPGAAYPIPGTNPIPRGTDDYAIEGTTVMYDVGKLFKVGGSTSYSSNTPASKKCFNIDINQYNVQVTDPGQMDFPRIMHNSVVLPDGRIFVVGGMNHAEPFSDIGAILTPEIWSPPTYAKPTAAYPAGQWNTNNLPAMQIPRTYHSVALLLQDGTVFVGGGGLCSGALNCVDHPDAEIYQPGYLFSAIDGSPVPRPSIVNNPETVAYNSNINVTTSEPLGTGGYFSLIRMSSVTHSTNNDQRYLKLNPTLISGNSYTMHIEGANILPPGYYMLFAINAAGVPSIAKSIRIGEEAKPCVIKPKYSLDGVWSNGRPTLGVPAGKSLVLSMFPDGQPFTISKVGGQTVTGDLNMGAVTTDKSGTYIITTTANGGCSTKLDLTVSTCSPTSTVAAYTTVPGANPVVWTPVTANQTIVISPGKEFMLGMTTPANGKFIIKLPNGQEAIDFNYKIGSMNSSHSGIYTITSEQGCSSSFNVRVPCVIPEYRMDGIWYNGTENMNLSVQAGKEITLSIMPNDEFNPIIKLPNGSTVGDSYTITNIQAAQNGTYTFTSPKRGCSTTMNLKVVPKTCSPAEIVPQYRLNADAWVTGTQDMSLTVLPGTNMTLSMMPDNIPLASIVLPNGQIGWDNYPLNNVTAANNGIYTFTSSTGCVTTLKLNVSVCSESSLIPEYNINGNWFSGIQNQKLTVANGAPVYLSMLPNGIGLTIKRPDGVIIGDNSFLGNMTTAQKGIYTLTSDQGCTTTLDISVPCTVIPEYNLNNNWYAGKQNIDLNVAAGSSLTLSMLPNWTGFKIAKPDNTISVGDYSIPKVTALNKGVYTIISDEGCSSSINVEVPPCSPNAIIPRYSLNGVWRDGKQNMNLIVNPGTPLVLSMTNAGTNAYIIRPNGNIVPDNYNAGNVTVVQNGVYTFVNSQGCTTTLNLTVGSCSSALIVPEYNSNGTWYAGTQNMNLDVTQYSALTLSTLPNYAETQMIFSPNGQYTFWDLNLPSVVLSHAGTYTFLTDPGCMTSLNLSVYIGFPPLKEEDVMREEQKTDEKNTVTFFPNPFAAALNIKLPADNDFHTLSLVDVLGRTLITKSVPEGKTEITLETENEFLEEGIYILKLQGANTLFSANVIYHKN